MVTDQGWWVLRIGLNGAMAAALMWEDWKGTETDSGLESADREEATEAGLGLGGREEAAIGAGLE